MFRRRTILIGCFFALAYGLLGLRLWQLQIWSAEHYRELSHQRTHRLQQTAPARGRILDRRGRVLAEDRASFDVWIKPASYIKVKGRAAEIVSSFGELTTDKIISLRATISTQSPQHELEKNLAITYLQKSAPLVQKLIPLLAKDGESPNDAQTRIAKTLVEAMISGGDDLTEPRKAFSDISLTTYLTIQQEQLNPYSPPDFHALDLRSGFSRIYNYPQLFGHLTGYVNALSAEEYKILRGFWDKNKNPVDGKGIITSANSAQRTFFAVEQNSDESEIMALRVHNKSGELIYTWGDLTNPLVGRKGIEQWYNQELRGQHTWRLEQLTKVAGGWRTFVNVGTPRAPKNGQDIKLTIDVDFQKKVRDIAVEELRTQAKNYEHKNALARHKLKEFSAAIVVMSAHTGEIYALVSLPEYDPNVVRRDYQTLAEDPRKPLLNRVISENYPPGSSLKPIVAASALEEGKIDRETRFLCQGTELLSNRQFVCMNKAHHGNIEVTEALKVSCNIFFYHVGGAMGSKILAHKLADYGIGRLTGIDLPGEVPGFLAANAFTGKKWSLGETWHIAIGQGQIDATPLQIATAYSMIANGGKKVRPHLRDDENDFELNEPQSVRVIPDDVRKIVKHGMWKVVQGSDYPRGTAWKSGHIRGFEYLGKTGSAQGKRPDTHAWFCTAAPAKEPEIIVCVMVPLGNHGGTTCAPIAKRIIEEYFHLHEFRHKQDDEEHIIDGDDSSEQEFTGDDDEAVG